MAGKTSKKSAKVAKKTAAKKVAAKKLPRRRSSRARRSRHPAMAQGRSCSQAAIPRSRKPTAMLRCRPTSRPCRAGKATSWRRLDALIARTVPNVYKAVKWNSPLYGIEGQGWFLGVHCFAKYIKVAFFRGASLRPIPPGASKQKDVRYLDIHEDDQVDEAQFAAWVKQASRLPGERM